LELLEIISSNKITPVFQPILNLKTGEVFGFEAFAMGPAEPYKTPKALFDEAKKLGLLKELDVVCAHQSLTHAPKGKNKIFVNIHPSTLIWCMSSKKRMGKLIDLSSPNQTIFEIIEVENASDYLTSLIEAVKNLQEAGYQIAIDDVASGFNRLQLVAELNPDYIKIDRCIIADCHLKPNFKTMLSFIGNLGQKLGAKVIAEGIEEKEEMYLLKELGIDYGQGFLFASPALDFSPKNNQPTIPIKNVSCLSRVKK
jgi:EAL domain-containing protein (putative c-di-GMP-specific phosphodiesterase class I)